MKITLPRGGVLHIAAATAAVLVALAVMWPSLFADRYPAFGDNISFWAPSTAFWTDQVRQDSAPLWNPYILGGVPFAADINHGLFYPPNWIALKLSAPAAIAVLISVHIALAVYGFFLFLRSEEIPGVFAVWGGLLFAFSASFLSLFNHVVMLESMAWLPRLPLALLAHNT